MNIMSERRIHKTTNEFKFYQFNCIGSLIYSLQNQLKILIHSLNDSVSLILQFSMTYDTRLTLRSLKYLDLTGRFWKFGSHFLISFYSLCPEIKMIN